MKLAKDCVDVALFTDGANPESMLEHWQQRVGLPFEEPLATGGGNLQHRHSLNGSVLKLNHRRTPLPDAGPSGYRGLWIAQDECSVPTECRDPDGNGVVLVPPGHVGVDQIAVVMAVRDARAFRIWFGETLGLDEEGTNQYRCGKTSIRFEQSPTATVQEVFPARGYRYLTIQVWDCDLEHQGILARGGTEAAAPRTLGQVARFSMVKDPDGNWIEISQRASLTGTLPPD